MGHTINPVSNRLKINIFWKSVWSSYTMYNYKYLVLSDLKSYKLISNLMKSKFLKKSFVVLAEWSLLFNNKCFIVFINYFSLVGRFFNKIKRKFLLLKKFKRYTRFKFRNTSKHKKQNKEIISFMKY